MKRAFIKWQLLAFGFPLGLAACVVGFGWLVRVASNAERPASCQSRLKEIGLALKEYTVDYDGRFPPALQGSSGRGWADSLDSYYKTPTVFQCPVVEDPDGLRHPEHFSRGARLKTGLAVHTDYFFNARLCGLAASRVKDAEYTVMMGDGDDEMDALSPHYVIGAVPEVWDTDANGPRRRHEGGGNILFADGHAMRVDAREAIPTEKSRDAWFSFAPG